MRVHHQRDEPPYDSPRTTNRTSRCNATRFHNPRLSPRDPGYPSVRQVFWLTPLRRTFPRLRGLSGFQRCNSMGLTATGLRRTPTCFPLRCSSFTNSHNPTDREVNFFLQMLSCSRKILPTSMVTEHTHCSLSRQHPISPRPHWKPHCSRDSGGQQRSRYSFLTTHLGPDISTTPPASATYS